MAMSLGDDGTMDTVIVCDNCGQEIRFTYSGESEETYEEFVKWALEDAEADHECAQTEED